LVIDENGLAIHSHPSKSNQVDDATKPPCVQRCVLVAKK